MNPTSFPPPEYSRLLRPLNRQHHAQYGNGNQAQYHCPIRTIGRFFLVLFGLFDMLRPLHHIMVRLINVEVDPVQQWPLQDYHRIELFVQVIQLVNWFYNFENLLISRVQVYIKFLLLNEIHAVIHHHFFSSHLQERRPCRLLQMFALFDKRPLLRPDLLCFFAQLKGQLVRHAFTSLVVSLGLKLWVFLNLVQKFFAFLDFLTLNQKVPWSHFPHTDKYELKFVFLHSP